MSVLILVQLPGLICSDGEDVRGVDDAVGSSPQGLGGLRGVRVVEARDG